jgi:hypothetical protein
MQTIVTDNVKLNNSAGVKRPQIPNDIRFPSVWHGLIMYWHIGSNKNAKAIVAITENFEFKEMLSV